MFSIPEEREIVVHLRSFCQDRRSAVSSDYLTDGSGGSCRDEWSRIWVYSKNWRTMVHFHSSRGWLGTAIRYRDTNYELILTVAIRGRASFPASGTRFLEPVFALDIFYSRQRGSCHFSDFMIFVDAAY